MNEDIIKNLIINNAKTSMLESIDGIDDIDFLKKELKEHLRNEFDLQQRIDNALEWIDRTIEIIKMQPSEDDTWILERLNSFKLCLRGDSND